MCFSFKIWFRAAARPCLSVAHGRFVVYRIAVSAHAGHLADLRTVDTAADGYTTADAFHRHRFVASTGVDTATTQTVVSVDGEHFPLVLVAREGVRSDTITSLYPGRRRKVMSLVPQYGLNSSIHWSPGSSAYAAHAVNNHAAFGPEPERRHRCRRLRWNRCLEGLLS